MKRKKTKAPEVFFAIVILGIAVAQFICRIVYNFRPDYPSQIGSRITEAVMLVVALILWRYTEFVQPGFGLFVEKEKRRRTAIGLVLLFILFVGELFLARIVGQLFIPGMAERPYFGLYLDVSFRSITLFVSFFQEILARSVLQHGLEKIFPGKHWPIACILSGAVFAMLHVHVSAIMMFGAIILAVVGGILYHYQKNVWTCAVIHFVFSFVPRCFGLII